MALMLQDRSGTPADRMVGRPLDVSHFLRIAIPLAGALRHVHEGGLIHKDIKPADILMDASSSGVADGVRHRLASAARASGPRSVDSRSDLF
jgi:serine/threonine protein kinase